MQITMLIHTRVLANAESQWDQTERDALVHKPGAHAMCSELSALAKASLGNPALSWRELEDESRLGLTPPARAFV